MTGQPFKVVVVGHPGGPTERIKFLLGAYLERFLIPEEHFTIGECDLRPQIAGVDRLGQLLHQSRDHHGASHLLHRARSYARVALELDASLEMTLRIESGEATPRGFNSDAASGYCASQFGVVAVLVARLKTSNTMMAYPGFYSTGYFGDKGVGVGQLDGMYPPVIEGAVATLRRDYTLGRLRVQPIGKAA